MEFNLRRLRLLRELEYRGTVSAVAAALSYSPATISNQLSLLQTEIGVPLLEPDGRRLRLTPQAHVLVAHTEAILNRLEQAQNDLLGSLDKVFGTVRIAAFQTAMLTLLPKAMTELRSKHPDLRVEAIQAESEITRSVPLPREVDLIIDEVYPGHMLTLSDQLDQRLLIVDPLRFATPAQLVQRDKLLAYANAPWVMEPSGSPAREWALSVCRHAGFEPDIAHESTDIVVHAQLVQAGHAVAFLPDLMVTPAPLHIHRRRLSPNHQRLIVTTCRTAERERPTIIAIREALREAARNPTNPTKERTEREG